MAKAVLISIRPEWAEKILNGEKTLEVRKNRPKLEAPYGEWRLVRRMAACGEYKCSVCGRIETFGCFNKPENNPYCHCGAKMELEDNHEN